MALGNLLGGVAFCNTPYLFRSMRPGTSESGSPHGRAAERSKAERGCQSLVARDGSAGPQTITVPVLANIFAPTPAIRLSFLNPIAPYKRKSPLSGETAGFSAKRGLERREVEKKIYGVKGSGSRLPHPF